MKQRFTSITLNPCYLPHSFYILRSTLHAKLLKNNHYKAKKFIVCNSCLNELEIFKTSIWLHNICVKLQTGNPSFEKWLSTKTSKILWPFMWNFSRVKVNVKNQNKMLFGRYFWKVKVPYPKKQSVPETCYVYFPSIQI